MEMPDPLEQVTMEMSETEGLRAIIKPLINAVEMDRLSTDEVTRNTIRVNVFDYIRKLRDLGF